MARSEVGTVTAVTGGTQALLAPDDVHPARVITRRRRLPGGRAALGAALMAVAAVGVFLAYADASAGPTEEIVVATRAIVLGQRITGRDVRLVSAEVPGPSRDATFASVDEVVGRVALAPIGEGEMLQASSITADRASAPAHEIALTLPRDQLAVGRLKPGERVDVFVTYDERTTSVARNAEVVEIVAASDGSLTSDREVGIVVAVPSGEVVAALVHALRTGEVTVVRSTWAEADDGAPLVYEPGGDDTSTDRTEPGSAGG